jgi:predicted DNA-binding transcriptional regulator AlpA
MANNQREDAFRLGTEAEVSKLIRVSGACLRHWRSVGKGPPWIKLGGRLVRYDLCELRRWVEKQGGARDAQ